MARLGRVGRFLTLALLGILTIASGCVESRNVRMKAGNDAVGPWMSLNSTFNHPTGPGPHPTWFGFLMQLGVYEGAGFQFDKIEFKYRGETTAEYAYDKANPNAFTWINLVGTGGAGGSGTVPMTKAQVDWFLPVPVFDISYTNVCSQLEACQGKDFCCDCDEDNKSAVISECLRQRKLHRELVDVFAILTYWEGKNGYVVESTDDGMFNSFEFVFNDPVELYVDGVKQNIEFDTIIIQEGPTGGINHGSRHDPSWPKGGG